MLSIELMYYREVVRRDEEACELRSEILRKNALIADLNLMNERLSAGIDQGTLDCVANEGSSVLFSGYLQMKCLNYTIKVFLS